MKGQIFLKIYPLSNSRKYKNNDDYLLYIDRLCWKIKISNCDRSSNTRVKW